MHDSWFTYYHFLDDDRAPDYARTVDIHRKPGYDPVELFVDPKLRLPKLRIASRLAQKVIGMRYLMDVISLDATLVRGSHGRPTDRPEDGPLFITSRPDLLGDGPGRGHRRQGIAPRSHLRRRESNRPEGRMKPLDLLGQWLRLRLPESAAAWLSSGIERCRTGIADRDLFLLISLVSRHVGKAPLALSEAELAAASASRPGWDPRDWTLDQAARVYLLCASTSDGAVMRERLDRLCAAGDVGELVALLSRACRSIPTNRDTPCARRKAFAPTCGRSSRRWRTAIRIRRNSWTSRHGINWC